MMYLYMTSPEAEYYYNRLMAQLTAEQQTTPPANNGYWQIGDGWVEGTACFDSSNFEARYAPLSSMARLLGGLGMRYVGVHSMEYVGSVNLHVLPVVALRYNCQGAGGRPPERLVAVTGYVARPRPWRPNETEGSLPLGLCVAGVEVGSIRVGVPDAPRHGSLPIVHYPVDALCRGPQGNTPDIGPSVGSSPNKRQPQVPSMRVATIYITFTLAPPRPHILVVSKSCRSSM